ncbi:MAG: A/G-specific adenine glycosylase [Salibacteraceae bacterium]
MTFSALLQNWYQSSQRDLPWRKTQDAYSIWLSEIILQQTRVQQGMAYYLKFKKHYPTVSDLAKAEEDEVLKHWQGLGYYSRARNLHATAKRVHEEFNGVFPTTYAEIRKLKGIGDYTAAAIASFAYNLPHAVVDGNVYRVLSRLYGDDTPIDSTQGKKLFQQLADELLDQKHPGNHNQAMMEFGALQCVPKNPDCVACPAQPQCKAFEMSRVEILPVKAKKTKQRNRYFHYLVPRFEEYLFIEKREDKGIWHNLYQFPLIEVPENIAQSKVPELEAWQALVGHPDVIIESVSETYKHILSHQRIFASFWRLNVPFEVVQRLEKKYLKITAKDLERYAIPRLIDRYLEDEQSKRQIGLPFNFR